MICSKVRNSCKTSVLQEQPLKKARFEPVGRETAKLLAKPIGFCKKLAIIKKYRAPLLILAMAGVMTAGHAQVDRQALESAQAPVTFVSSYGPHAVFNTLEEIRQIGAYLGQVISGGAAFAGELNRYFVTNAVSASPGGRQNADIFGIGSDALVNHIRNVRVILQGYLQEAYGYSAADALVLAELITVYNAVFRGNWDHFAERYNDLALENLDSGRAGISVHFSEWPGQTLMVIPLITAVADAPAVDTLAVADDQVLEELRERDDMGLQLRQDLVDLLEREAEEAELRAAAELEALAEEEQRIAEEWEALAEEEQRIAEEAAEVEQQLNGIGAQLQQIQDQIVSLQEQLLMFQQQLPEEIQQELQMQLGALQGQELVLQQQEQELALELELLEDIQAVAQQLEDLQTEEMGLEEIQNGLLSQLEDLAQQQQELAEWEDQLLADEDGLEERLELAEFLQERAEEMNGWAQQELVNIADDEHLLMMQEEIFGYFVVTVEMEQFDSSVGRPAIVNPFTGEVVRRSPLETVFAQTLTDIEEGGLFAIARGSEDESVVRLVELDRFDLTVVNQNDQDISPSSFLLLSGGYIYAVVVEPEDGGHYLARFDMELVLMARSQDPIHPASNVIIQHGWLFTHREDGSPKVLDPVSLQE